MDKWYISKINFFYDSGMITEQKYKEVINLAKKGFAQRQKEKRTFTPKHQFNSVLGLRNALIRLKKLGLITSIKPKTNTLIIF
jgi:hypothetical protein